MWAQIRRIVHTYRFSSGRQARAGLRYWYQTPLGRSLAATEQALLDEALGNLFGYNLLQVGGPQGNDLSAISRIPVRLQLLDEGGPGDAGGNFLVGLPECLPLAGDSIDVLLLPHLLGFADEPHEVLREAERVLVADGHVVLLGFNPWSLWGLCRLLLGWQKNTPWNSRFLSPRRVREWLSLLGFETVELRYLYYRPPLRQAGMLQGLQLLEHWGARAWRGLGGVYLLVAKKRLAGLTPIRPRRRGRQGLLAPGLVNSSLGKQKHGG